MQHHKIMLLLSNTFPWQPIRYVLSPFLKIHKSVWLVLHGLISLLPGYLTWEKFGVQERKNIVNNKTWGLVG